MTHDLLSRLSAATEGSAELDRDMLLACGWKHADARCYSWLTATGDIVGAYALPHPTRSLDDITRMIEAEGMEWWKMTGHRGDAGRWIEPPWVWVGHPGRMKAVMLPDPRRICLALCEGFVRAREAGR